MPDCLIIAEAGVNHNGDPDMARALIDVAAQAGADIVKFQSFSASALATPSAAQAPYQARNQTDPGGQRNMLERLELPFEIFAELFDHCRSRNIEFLTTCFDTESLDRFRALGQKRFKIPSGEITNLPYLRHLGTFDADIILSTGMANLGEIEMALDALEQAGTKRHKVTVLHCTSDYPARMADLNLRAIETLRAAFGVRTGYSDHSIGIEAAIAAITLGAAVIEKHFTLDRNLPGPDHSASLEPDELAAMIDAIRNIERALGSGVKRPMPGETENRAVVRRALVASRPIARGEPFGNDNITAKRPENGISPMRIDDVLGRTAPRAFDTDEPIEL